jgi:predicted KAP-like P-loop ATPase
VGFPLAPLRILKRIFFWPSRRRRAAFCRKSEQDLLNENMTNKFHHNDQPIAQPDEDRFGIDPFAKAIASSIREMASPQGAVIALNGPWGSGKSSAVNLVRYHLREAVAANEIVVINFACWWFRGE